jgi:two-component system, chemotaxis family, protein-glutamate methylesterase/glutaminase
MTRDGQDKIRVLVVDDSALMSRQIASILSEDDSLHVVGRAKDGLEALTLVKELSPDVVTMDVEMPRMNGITALKHIMVKYSVPTVMISALTKEGARTTFDALKYGAIDVIAKPSRREDENLDAQKADIIGKVKRAAAIRSGRSKYIKMSAPIRRDEKIPKGSVLGSTRFVIMGAGTGGYYGLLRIIPGLTSEFSDVLIAVILVSDRYLEPFATYLDAHSIVPVQAITGPFIPERGACYLCSRDRLLDIQSTDGTLSIAPFSANGNEGSIDHVMKSAARNLGERVIGVIMSGAGNDGAEGIAAIRDAKGTTMVQDINSCMDPSMPIAVLEKCSVDRILPDYHVAEFLSKRPASETSESDTVI